jgi:hypothetical protein
VDLRSKRVVVAQEVEADLEAFDQEEDEVQSDEAPRRRGRPRKV